MTGKRLKARLETRRDRAHVADDVALLVNLQGLESDGRRYRMAAIGVAGTVGAELTALLDESLVNGV